MAKHSHRARIAFAAEPVFDAVAAIAQKNQFAVERGDARLRIDAPLGEVVFLAGKGTTDVSFTTDTPAELQLLIDLYAQRFQALGLDAGMAWENVDGTVPLNQIRAVVSASERISPNFARIRLEGDFSTFAKPNAGLHFRFLFGPKDAPLPYLDDGGLTVWPVDVKAWHRPPYTVRRIAKDASWIDVDIVLHRGGRVTDWFADLELGTEIGLNGPSGSKLPAATSMLLFGDETALPVVLRIIEDAKAAAKVRAIIAVRNPADAQKIEATASVDASWVDMTNISVLLDAARDLLPGTTAEHVFFAAERAQASKARELFKEHGIGSDRAKAASYWTRS
ncbi:MAG: siderophore-interacting protein [Pseudomonadota bacterium]